MNTQKSTMEHLMSKDYGNRNACPVCHEPYDDKAHAPFFAMSPGCGHTVCCSCLEQIIATNPICPTCRVYRFPCAPSDVQWAENFNLILILPTLEKKQSYNDQLKKENGKLAKENEKWYKKLEELSGKAVEKNQFAEKLNDKPQSVFELPEIKERIGRDWITNWQYLKATDLVNELDYDNNILERLNEHLNNDITRIRTECGLIEFDLITVKINKFYQELQKDGRAARWFPCK